MSKDESFEQVLARLRQRDDDAATKVYQRFARGLIVRAHKQLDPRILQKVDADDVVQSVFKSAFLRLGDGQFILGGWDDLWGLLTRVTLHKCHKWVEAFQTQARHLDREASPTADVSQSWQFLDREPTPPEVAVLAETVEQILRGLDERAQKIVGLSLQGYDAAEVSAQLGCTESKVYRVLRLIRQRLERLRDNDGE